jgi:hypothetical protein
MKSDKQALGFTTFVKSFLFPRFGTASLRRPCSGDIESSAWPVVASDCEILQAELTANLTTSWAPITFIN